MSENYNEGQEFDIGSGKMTPIKMFPWGSPTIGQIAGALAKAQGMMHNPTKAKKVEQKRWSKAENKYVDASYMYASLNEIQNAARQALAENGISVFQPVSGDISRIEITTVLLHSSGEWMATEPLFTTPVGIGDRGPSVQDMGSLITYLRRYSLCSALNLSAAEDDTDGKTEGDEEPKLPQRVQRGTEPQKQEPQKDYSQPPKSNTKQQPPAQQQPQTQQPQKQEPKPEPKQQPEPQPEPSGNLDDVKAEFADALDFWLGLGEHKGNPIWTKPFLDTVGKRLVDSCAISSQDTEQWIADDYKTFMARMDFESARKDWKDKGMTDDGLQEMVNGLHEAGEINDKFIDKLTENSYKHLIDVVDTEMGIKKE